MDTIATKSLVKSICLFLQQNNIKVRHDISQHLLRANDQLIMKHFPRDSLSLSELETLNRCSLLLQVSFLSEIFTADGTMVTEDAWHGKRFEIPNKALSWPQQQHPRTKDWETWQVF
jgi:primosomal protein N''